MYDGSKDMGILTAVTKSSEMCDGSKDMGISTGKGRLWSTYEVYKRGGGRG